jgi:hypothetical protein
MLGLQYQMPTQKETNFKIKKMQRGDLYFMPPTCAEISSHCHIRAIVRAELMILQREVAAAPIMYRLCGKSTRTLSVNPARADERGRSKLSRGTAYPLTGHVLHVRKVIQDTVLISDPKVST